MPWIQLSATTDKTHAGFVEDVFLELSAVSVTLMDAADSPILEPEPGKTPIWNDTRIMALYPAETDIHQLMEAVTQRLAEQSKLIDLRIKSEILEDKDWEREWMKNFHPIQCGKQLWICPSWRTPPDKNATNLHLDPGLAFGTGSHPTTFLCLNWLDAQSLDQKTVMDYGCGSGILAIAALLLGAESAIGIDIDPQALTATMNNAERNHLPESKLRVFTPQTLPLQFSQSSAMADVLLANILAQPLVDLATSIAEHVKPGGLIALSGIVANQAESVSQRYSEWFELEAPEIKDEWVLIHGRKR